MKRIGGQALSSRCSFDQVCGYIRFAFRICDRFFADPQTGVAPGVTRSRNVRSRCRCSMCPAIHINSRSWLRSSSTHEPSDPPPRVVKIFSFLSACRVRATNIRRTGLARRSPCFVFCVISYEQTTCVLPWRRPWMRSLNLGRVHGFSPSAYRTTQVPKLAVTHGRGDPKDFRVL